MIFTWLENLPDVAWWTLLGIGVWIITGLFILPMFLRLPIAPPKRPAPGDLTTPAVGGSPDAPLPASPVPGPHHTGGLRYTMREDWCGCRHYYDPGGNRFASDTTHRWRPRVPVSADWDAELERLTGEQP